MLVWVLVALLGSRGIEPLQLPLTRLKDVSVFDALLNYPPIKAFLPIPVLIAIAPAVIWFFRSTWRQLDAEAAEYRAQVLGKTLRDQPPGAEPRPAPARRRWRVRRAAWRRSVSASPPLRRLGRRQPQAGSAPATPAQARSLPSPWSIYHRPAVCLVITAVVLTMQDYYGGRNFYTATIQPWLRALEAEGYRWLDLKLWDELFGYGWWVAARVIGYVLVPFSLWKLLFPKDSLLDLGLRTRDFLKHAWVYGLCLAIVLPLLLVVARQPDFGNYYPFYKNCSRSWLDFALWQGIYWLQFLALEMFFRGWMVGALRKTMGSAAIFAMAVPYCMIHYGKPYLEAHGAIVAGIVLGSLAMRTRSIYSGFLVHITVAFLMDLLAIWKSTGLPTALLPP